jgi:hypothetical protein
MLNQLENTNALTDRTIDPTSNPTSNPPANLTATPVTSTRTEGAQTMLDRVAAWELEIPDFSFPAPEGDRRSLTAVRLVPPEFVEQMSVAMKGIEMLSRGGTEPEDLRDLAQYSIAYGPVADAIERLGAKMRHSVEIARAKAGAEALLTFRVAERLSVLPGTTHLAPLVAGWRRTLRTARRFSPVRKAKKDGTETPAPTPTAPVTPEPHTP